MRISWLTLCVACSSGTVELQGDVDGDRLDARAEIEHRTDAINPDTDGDGYLDGDEVAEGVDPLDPDARIYEGNWPYWHAKDSLDDWDRGPAEVGDAIVRLVGVDQFGDDVDLYDFGGPDSPHDWLIVDACVPWLEPCGWLSSWLAGGEDPQGFEERGAALRNAVDEGRVGWVTVLTQSATGGIPRRSDLRAWHEAYPHPRVAVVADGESLIENGLVASTGGWPSYALISTQDMRIVEIAPMGTTAIGSLGARFSGQ